MLRIYNPTVQIEKRDTEGIFIRQLLPELSKAPIPHIYEPWKLTLMEQTFYDCKMGMDYPIPIIDFEKATKKIKLITGPFVKALPPKKNYREFG